MAVDKPCCAGEQHSEEDQRYRATGEETHGISVVHHLSMTYGEIWSYRAMTFVMESVVRFVILIA